MSIEVRLDSSNAPLKHLTLRHVMLDRDESPSAIIDTNEHEVLLYSLVGRMRVTIDERFVGVIGGRRDICEPHIHAVRMPAHNDSSISMEVDSNAADALLVSCEKLNNHRWQSTPPYLHYNDAYWHDVGEDTYARRVGELPTPKGFCIHAGETLNKPGAWSSFPAHATPEEAATRYADHEECFYVITPGYALMHLSGRYVTGETRSNDVQRISNGEALVTPLGAHEIVFSPQCWGYYAWFYRSFLQKTYNRFAHEGVKTYVR